MNKDIITEVHQDLIDEWYNRSSIYEQLTIIRWSKAVILGRIKSIMTSKYTEISK